MNFIKNYKTTVLVLQIWNPQKQKLNLLMNGNLINNVVDIKIINRMDV
jgi:hypothetical protein